MERKKIRYSVRGRRRGTYGGVRGWGDVARSVRRLVTCGGFGCSAWVF
ncbi:hypothetical protein ES288_D04G051600v1 [Gossypium darwinii]|uniref:Uncharacterized protein n=1 Tax=Gossypium darwinii TaxID=34276 RepID=A0A5D2CX69_GOSDA|nr:hypothetical protein ES288_D04G051600v1 [Gossypium darwinii]